VIFAVLVIVAMAEANTVVKFEVREESNDNHICPDGGVCPGDQTCCIMRGGRYGCCPYATGTCCPDLAHCCPLGKTCSGSSCIGVTNFAAIIAPLGSNESPSKA